eukprot:TRINITY_DN60571_c0_g1_i1.p1 TRINITY_DN60571_c0_g1~~TRINITY_DN60571_c0_g1_i1.p1  ORF type:complete len:120 (+),score=5.44 TRINITY_DN60571_c0_g1_i1:491-850(+)
MLCLLGGHLPWMPLSCRTVVSRNSICVVSQCGRCGYGDAMGDCTHMVLTKKGCSRPCTGCSKYMTCPTGRGAIAKIVTNTEGSAPFATTTPSSDVSTSLDDSTKGKWSKKMEWLMQMVT